MVLTIPATLASGAVADRIGREPLLMFATVFAVVFAFPMFLMFETENPLVIAIGLILGLAVIQGITIGVSAAMIAELFPARTRWSGIALCREIPAAVIGRTAPFIATWLVSLAGGTPWLVACYMMLLSLIGVIAVWKLPETLTTKSM